MSGPIVRKYGFPNFDKIFGERPLEHGVEDPAQPEAQAESGSTEPKPEPASRAKAAGTGKTKKGKKA
jgi:hypothetical protein